MCFTIHRSKIDPHLLEVWDGTCVVVEIEAPFQIKGTPPSFVTVDELKNWLLDTEWKLAKSAAYRILSLRSQTRFVLQRKLQERGFSLSICEKLLNELEANSYLQDEEYAERLILKMFKKGYGPYYMEKKLELMGLDSQLVRKQISDSIQRKQVRALISKYSIGALKRRGFDWEILREFIGRD